MGGFLKRRYLDLRMGGVTINPLIQAANFTMLAYLTIENFIPLWLFAPLFIGGVFSAFTVSGLLFRKVQMSTDEDLKYERQTELNKTLFEMAKQLKKISEKNGITLDDSFEERLDELKRIVTLC